MLRNYYERILRHRRRRTESIDGHGIILETEEVRILRRRGRPSGIDRGTFTNFDGPDIIITRRRRRHRLPFSLQSSFPTSGNDRHRSLSYSFSLEGPNSVSPSFGFADGHIIINVNASNSRPNPHPPRHHGAMVRNEYTPLHIAISGHHRHHQQLQRQRQHQHQHQHQRGCSELERREQAGLGNLSDQETISSGRDSTAHVSSENQEAQICVICQVEYEKNELIMALPCNHCFHANCITRWLQERNMCPLCRAIP